MISFKISVFPSHKQVRKTDIPWETSLSKTTKNVRGSQFLDFGSRSRIKSIERASRPSSVRRPHRKASTEPAVDQYIEKRKTSFLGEPLHKTLHHYRPIGMYIRTLSQRYANNTQQQHNHTLLRRRRKTIALQSDPIYDEPTDNI